MAMPEPAPSEIGAAMRQIRERRNWSLELVAGRLGMTRQNLSKYERGENRIIKRGLLNKFAEAYECHVLDLTGEPYLPVDEQSAIAHSTITPIQLALIDSDLDDVPDQAARPLDDLVRGVREANRQRDLMRYEIASRDLSDLLIELQVVAATGDEAQQKRALTSFVEACLVAYVIAKNFGFPTLCVEAARRGLDAAKRLGDPTMLGFGRYYYALALMRLGAHRRAAATLATAIEQLAAVADPHAEDTLGAEVYGLLQLTSALEAARTGQADAAMGHLAEAERMAARTGERNGLIQHFGPTNCAAWELSIGVELGEGGGIAERVRRKDVNLAVFDSPSRVGAWHFDLARAFAQDGGSRDMEALRHLDTAVRTAPQRLAHDPIARELVMQLDNRAKMATWELASLRNRFGLHTN